uniref:Transferase family protein n=1 Tax=Oryza punctata TaxID=4537 RepID=A0A0E0M590_ORYPU
MATFTARRRKAELVAPARPTPHEHKALSDIDSQRGLELYAAGVEFFHHRHAATTAPVLSGDDTGGDPVGIIRAALAEALVSFYPLAGRLREVAVAGGGGSKLVVECTAEGVVFVEADADVQLQELGQPLAPPYPCVEELLCSNLVGEPDVVVGKPLLFMQVTRLRNNEGFCIGYHYCHTITDAFGMAQLLHTVYRLARRHGDGELLTNPPVWERDLLVVTLRRASPRITHVEHPAYEPLPISSSDAAAQEDVVRTTPREQMVTRYFHLGPTEMAAMRGHVPLSATVFELVTAALWRCRTAALGYAPTQRVRVLVMSSARWSWKRDPPLPRGFYGNLLVPQIAEATAGELCGRPLAHAVELLRRRKFEVTDEYMRSMIDMLARRGRPSFNLDWTYVVADVGGLGRSLGGAAAAMVVGRWERAGGGITAAGQVIAASLYSYYERCRGEAGEEAAVVSMCLPAPAMERFAREITACSNSRSAISAM